MRKKYPSAGDILVDWIFKRLIYILERELVRKKKGLYDPDVSSRQAVLGFLYFNDRIIYLNSSKRAHPTKIELTKTLVHELAHLLFPDVSERYIKQIEEILWIKLTNEQKKFLKRYIPKYEVTKNPKKPA